MSRFVVVIAFTVGCTMVLSGTASAGGAPTGATSPAAAARGVIANEISGSWAEACSYFMPSFYEPCMQAAAKLDAKHFRFRGSLTLRQTVQKGSRALVAVTGRICPSTGQGCQDNANPSLGMPGPKRSFAAAFAAAIKSSSNSFSPVPCIEIVSRWYVDATQ
jgi:hypothetical protein